jgi:hypothetical protein
MMKRLISSLFITGCLWAVANLSEHQPSPQTTAQLSTSSQLSYLQSQKASARIFD